MDIAQQLRESCFCNGRGCELCRAADEIERLRQAIVDIQGQVFTTPIIDEICAAALSGKGG